MMMMVSSGLGTRSRSTSLPSQAFQDLPCLFSATIGTGLCVAGGAGGDPCSPPTLGVLQGTTCPRTLSGAHSLPSWSSHFPLPSLLGQQEIRLGPQEPTLDGCPRLVSLCSTTRRGDRSDSGVGPSWSSSAHDALAPALHSSHFPVSFAPNWLFSWSGREGFA